MWHAGLVLTRRHARWRGDVVINPSCQCQAASPSTKQIIRATQPTVHTNTSKSKPRHTHNRVRQRHSHTRTQVGWLCAHAPSTCGETPAGRQGVRADETESRSSPRRTRSVMLTSNMEELLKRTPHASRSKPLRNASQRPYHVRVSDQSCWSGEPSTTAKLGRYTQHPQAEAAQASRHRTAQHGTDAVAGTAPHHTPPHSTHKQTNKN